MNKLTNRIYLSPPHMCGSELMYINEAFDSNWIAPLGPNVEAFEKELASYVGVEGALALNSGTAAIHLALRLLGVSKGDAVFCSSLTFVASANPILYQGAIPVFIDSEPGSWNMSPQALERALMDAERSNTLPKAVIVVNLYGQSADLDPLLNLCNHYGVPIIEDAAESLGATYKNKASGTIGKYGVYSFNGNKIITTSGGGMLVSNDKASLDKARFWATQSRDQAVYYQHSEMGYNYRLSNILAGVGRAQLQVLEDRVNSRREVFNRYYNHFSKMGNGIRFMPEANFGRSTRWLTALMIDKDKVGVSSLDLLAELEKMNIEARPVWKPLHLQPLFSMYKYYSHSQFESISEQLFKNGLCIPSGSSLTEKEQNKVIGCIDHCLSSVKRL
ncbi:DegT/DnrJ/EryC1/StrS family aminotransferase [Paenibacillus hexagrammi]|uniref:Aminotransferase class I/II-fold pyridoxal phosphate-dependent enzyme n=1 Tax=Paenibacillus hexagrammi TaxID=2908839 RepID=A0ABY3SLI9_9BACL|nr:aminotransferase class I/II-fold pyridoxal phosphate-dependent enzyme [Paenibacillus sp. YPD9-1]